MVVLLDCDHETGERGHASSLYFTSDACEAMGVSLNAHQATEHFKYNCHKRKGPVRTQKGSMEVDSQRSSLSIEPMV